MTLVRGDRGGLGASLVAMRSDESERLGKLFLRSSTNHGERQTGRRPRGGRVDPGRDGWSRLAPLRQATATVGWCSTSKRRPASCRPLASLEDVDHRPGIHLLPCPEHRFVLRVVRIQPTEHDVRPFSLRAGPVGKQRTAFAQPTRTGAEIKLVTTGKAAESVSSMGRPRTPRNKTLMRPATTRAPGWCALVHEMRSS